MNALVEDNSGTAAVRPGYELDLGALDAWMRANVADYAGPLTVEQFKGGQSNPTYKLITPGKTYVLRKQPPGLLLKGAHALDREAKVLTSLSQAGFPVAAVHGLCTDPAIIGTIFYVMDMVEGRIFWDAAIPEVSHAERAALFDAMNATIADLHSIDHVAAGLADYGRPGNYFERQIARWSRQYLEDAEAGRDPYMDRLVEWLPAHIPPGEDTSIVHGDFRIDNLIFHPTQPRVLAVLDWELSTLGHPGADFAYHAMMYRMPPHIVAGLGGSDPAALGIADEEAYLAAYCRRRGLADMPGYDFYIAFNFFRLAAIFHGIKGRVIRGNASSAQARERVAVLPELMRLAWRQAESAGAR
ncbi:phosphotransferase family protein [Sphingobium ummariense]|uniref:Aminoglycoside phosphotransferase n=1 Tax=Sphingobium ummariense RL-3 TaxID=1346791 RepID=T0IPQ8_9SPHN|nr:phosphotransferase family protein [Sphingobium ummariense]EQB30825.1 aminoglycoside phosphotransferase [Sphingobium ummariense RL-3]